MCACKGESIAEIPTNSSAPHDKIGKYAKGARAPKTTGRKMFRGERETHEPTRLQYVAQVFIT